MKIGSDQDPSPEALFAMIISIVGIIVGFLTLFSFMTEAFYNFVACFFGISLISQIFCLLKNTGENKPLISLPLGLNPYFHNAICFFVAIFCHSTSILYILDTIFMHLSLLTKYLPKSQINTYLSQYVESVSTKKLLTIIEIFTIPELFLWMIFNFSFGAFFLLNVYIFDIAMFLYAISPEAKKVYQSIYKFIRNQSQSPDGLQQLFNVLLDICNQLHSITKSIYK